MKCPVCDNVSLVMSERNGIEIDYCPTCRGVWLDRGELDKIIERSNVPHQPQHIDNRREKDAYRDARQSDGYSHGHANSSHQGDYHKKHKREGFLGQLFDFD